MTILSFKQAVLKKGGAKKSKKEKGGNDLSSAPPPKRPTDSKNKANDTSNHTHGNGVIATRQADLNVMGSAAESLVLLKLRCVHRRVGSQSRSTNTEQSSEDSDNTDFVILDGPCEEDCYVQAKLLDVSASNSRCVTDSDSEGSRGEARAPQLLSGVGISPSNSSCAIYEDTDDYSDSMTTAAMMTITRSSTPEADSEEGGQGQQQKQQQKKMKKKEDQKKGEGDKKKLYIKIPETPSLVNTPPFQAHSSSPLGSAAEFTAHTPNEYNFVYPNTPHQKVSIELDCPHSLVGRLIGKNGSTVRNLELKTGVSIQIDQSLPDGCPRKVKICGHPQLIDHAERIVEEVIRHGPPELNKRNVYKMELNAIAYEQAQAKAQAHPAKRNLFAKVFKQMQGPHAATFPTSEGHQRKKKVNAAPAVMNPSFYPVVSNGFGDYEMVNFQSPHSTPGYLPAPHYPLQYVNNMCVPGYTLPPAYHVAKPKSFKVAATAALAAGRFWSQHQSPTGQKYFLNHLTGKITNLEED